MSSAGRTGVAEAPLPPAATTAGASRWGTVTDAAGSGRNRASGRPRPDAAGLASTSGSRATPGSRAKPHSDNVAQIIGRVMPTTIPIGQRTRQPDDGSVIQPSGARQVQLEDRSSVLVV